MILVIINMIIIIIIMIMIIIIMIMIIIIIVMKIIIITMINMNKNMNNTKCKEILLIIFQVLPLLALGCIGIAVLGLCAGAAIHVYVVTLRDSILDYSIVTILYCTILYYTMVS